MRLLQVDKVAIAGKISTQRVEDILKNCSFVSTDLTESMCEADHASDVILDEINTYDDVYNRVDYDQKTSMYIYRNKKTKKRYLMCFKPTETMARFRSIKQKLADVSTSHILQHTKDKDYERFMHVFYTSTNTLLSTYAKMRHLDIPRDICLFYKGGNLYRILLSELFNLIPGKEYADLLKRSDADFQLFINPKLTNYDKVFQEASILVLFSMYSFKRYLLTNNMFNTNVKLDDLVKGFEKEIGEEKHNIVLDPIKGKKDFLLTPSVIDDQEYILYKDVPSLLHNIPIMKPSLFYISKNTAIKFKRKDNTYNAFDLYRMKYFFKVRIDDATSLSVPSEIIDVSIPKPEDNSIGALVKDANKWLRQYHYKSDSAEFTFWGPSLNYMIKDVDAILFFQNEFPWQDKKIGKRIQRYFLCLILHTIVSATDDPILHLNTFKVELRKLIKLLTCINESSQCEVFGDENFSGMFYTKYKKILAKLNSYPEANRAAELREMKEFNVTLISISKKMIAIVLHIIANTHKNVLKHLQEKVNILHNTTQLG